jgi:uncharacterized protein YjbI with pentapeptide repeats
MNPTVVAAIIAAIVSVLTLIGTLAAQYLGRRGTSKDTEKAFAEQRKQLNETLQAQSDQLDKTLAEQRARTLNERFATAADQVGSDKPAVRLAGVYAMANLADDWDFSKTNQQTCVDVLCAYLRMPYEPDPGKAGSVQEQLAFQSSREVRHTVIRVIVTHLKDGAPVSWQGLNFDFTGVVFDGGSFTQARFSGGEVNFTHAEFSGSEVGFAFAEFSGGTVNFHQTKFSGGTVVFYGTEFTGGIVNFQDAEFSGGTVNFRYAKFSGSQVSFYQAKFAGGTVSFRYAKFTGGIVSFYQAKFSSGEVIFEGAEFSGGIVSFAGAEFSGGAVTFDGAEFSGGTVGFEDAEFSGGTVSSRAPKVWSHPPTFSWTGTPPAGVELPSLGAP